MSTDNHRPRQTHGFLTLSPTQDQVTTHKQLENMMVFPYCVGDSGQPQPSQDKAKFEWVTHRLGAEDESFFILDGLKEAKEGMVYGTRLRAFNPVNDKEKQHEVIESVISLCKYSKISS